MSLFEKNRRSSKGESKAHSLLHKYDLHKMTNVVNHIHFERKNGFESPHHKEKKS